MKKITIKTTALLTFLIVNNLLFGQCANSSNIYSFVYNGRSYEVVRENKTWIDAAACAVERGGILTEINDAAEQNAIFTELNTNSSITLSNTTAPDGGNGAYVWIGGNDLATEGNWVWDGNNDNNSTQFWSGTSTGSPVGGLYNNWGNEPDDYFGQDALALSLNGWPLGVAGQWNDVDHNTNSLYFVIEYSTLLSEKDINFKSKIKLFPNPVIDFATIQTNGIDLGKIVILNSLGQRFRTINLEGNLDSKKIDLSNLNSGLYLIKIDSKNGESIIKKIIK